MISKKEIRYNHGLHGDSRGFTDSLVKVLDIEAAMEEYADALQKENDNLKKEYVYWKLEAIEKGKKIEIIKNEFDNFSISFAVWCLYDQQAKAYLNSGISAYGLLEKYKDRPYIDNDTSKQ